MLKRMLIIGASAACLAVPAAAESYVKGDRCGGTYTDRKSEMMAGSITGGTRYKCTPFPQTTAATTTYRPTTTSRSATSTYRYTSPSATTRTYATTTPRQNLFVRNRHLFSSCAIDLYDRSPLWHDAAVDDILSVYVLLFIWKPICDDRAADALLQRHVLLLSQQHLLLWADDDLFLRDVRLRDCASDNLASWYTDLFDTPNDALQTPIAHSYFSKSRSSRFAQYRDAPNDNVSRHPHLYHTAHDPASHAHIHNIPCHSAQHTFIFAAQQHNDVHNAAAQHGHNAYNQSLWHAACNGKHGKHVYDRNRDASNRATAIRLRKAGNVYSQESEVVSAKSRGEDPA